MKWEKKKILIVAVDFPYPPNYGGIVDIWKRIKALNKMGFEIDLLATIKVEPQKELKEIVLKYVKEIILVKREMNFINLLSFRPFQIESRKKLKKIHLSNKIYDYVILEGFYVYAVLFNPTLNYKKIIMRVHNDEHMYFKNLSMSISSLFKKVYYQFESWKFKFIEPYIMSRIENFMFISQNEKNNYEKKYSLKKTCFLPPAVEMEFDNSCKTCKNVLFIGALNEVNNREAIQYYIENIHGKLNDIKEYKLIIVGNTKGKQIDWLYRIVQKFNNIEIHENPLDLKKYYKNAAVFVNPVLHGAGVKIKNIDAVMNGLPVVSTSIGSEGSGFISQKHFLLSNSIDEFVKAINLLLQDSYKRESIVSNAQDYIMKNYNSERILREFFLRLEKN